MDSVLNVVERRFSRLVYSGQQVRLHEPVTAEGIEFLMGSAASIDPAIDVSLAAPKQSDLKDKKRLQEFMTSHCRVRHYSFQIKKCGAEKSAFGMCQSPRLPADVQDDLVWFPDPVVDDESPEHYKK